MDSDYGEDGTIIGDPKIVGAQIQPSQHADDSPARRANQLGANQDFYAQQQQNQFIQYSGNLNMKTRVDGLSGQKPSAPADIVSHKEVPDSYDMGAHQDKSSRVGNNEAALGLPKETQWQQPYAPNPLQASAIQDADVLDEKMYESYNQYIRVEVSGPMWSNEGVVGGNHRIYRIITKLKDNPDYAIQVHRRYNDLKWLIQVIQVEHCACVFPPIPQQLVGSQYYKDDSEEILQRVQGIQRFLDYVTQHSILCANKDLECFLTGQDHQFESRRQQSEAAINANALNQSLSNVLLDGNNVLQAVGSEKSYYGKTIKLAKKAGKGISAVGGAVAGALWSGANYIAGGQGETKDQGGGETMQTPMPTAQDDKELQKVLDVFIMDEIFMEKYLNQLTVLEKEFQKNIVFTEAQQRNQVKLSESFGKLGNVQKISTHPPEGQTLEDISLSQQSQRTGQNSYEQLQHTAVRVGQVLSDVNSYKKSEVEVQIKEFRAPLETFRLKIIGAMSACQRYKLIAKFNHEKQLEIQKMEKTAGSIGYAQQMPEQRSNFMQQQNMMAGQQDPNIDTYMSQTTARYLHDMRIEKDEIQARLDLTRKILEIELRKFKRSMVQQFQELAQRFSEYQLQQAQREQELWDQLRQQQFTH